MASIGDVAAALRAAIAMVEQVTGAVKRADGQLDDALTSLQADLSDSSNTLAHEGISQWNMARERLAEALALLAGGTEQMSTYATSIAGGGPIGGGGGGATVPPWPQTSSGPPPRRRLEGFNAKRVHKGAVADIRRAGYPKNVEGKTSARAFVYTADGEQLNAEPLKPYRKGEAPPQADLKDPWASSADLTTTWHLERDAAAMIRSQQLDGAAFYLNVPLCGRRAEGSEYPDPNKCYENFRHIIPKDAVAYVYVIPERGTPSQRRIVGTGEGIKHDR